MSLVQAQLFSGVHTIMEYADPRMAEYPLMGTPLHILAILTFYVIFVFKTGPSIMKNRQPLKLNGVIMAYNWLQIILNGAVFVAAIFRWNQYSLFCTPMEKGNTPIEHSLINLQYSYTMLKILDLLDTIFFVLRKKNNQVTFLHVYHHILMATFAWVTCKFCVGGQVYYLGITNLFVHAVMYFYYFLTAWNSTYKQSIWWKKYITQLQILQHWFIFTAFVLPLLNPQCPYPKPLLGFYLLNSGFMIYLFTKFYVNTYMRKKPKSQ